MKQPQETTKVGAVECVAKVSCNQVTSTGAEVKSQDMVPSNAQAHIQANSGEPARASSQIPTLRRVGKFTCCRIAPKGWQEKRSLDYAFHHSSLANRRGNAPNMHKIGPEH